MRICSNGKKYDLQLHAGCYFLCIFLFTIVSVLKNLLPIISDIFTVFNKCSSNMYQQGLKNCSKVRVMLL